MRRTNISTGDKWAPVVVYSGGPTAMRSGAVRRVVVGALPAALAFAGCGRVETAPSPRLSDGDYLRALRLMVPVAGATPERVRDTYSARRGERLHEAIDIHAPRGTPVLATVDGTILRVSSNSLGGKTLYATDRGRRFVFYYAHLDGYAARSREGARVRQGDIIGYVGTTGNAPSDTPHLHFQVLRMLATHQWWAGPPVNPYGYFASAGAPRGRRAE